MTDFLGTAMLFIFSLVVVIFLTIICALLLTFLIVLIGKIYSIFSCKENRFSKKWKEWMSY